MRIIKYILSLNFLLESTIGISQKSLGLTTSSANPLSVNYTILEQFLWGYSKSNSGLGQKGKIDFDAIDNWRGLGDYLSVSDDGEFFAYTIQKPSNKSRYSGIFLNDFDSLVVQSIHSSFRLAFADAKPGFFSSSCKEYIFQQKDNLCFLQIDSPHIRRVKNIISYKVIQSSKNEWLASRINHCNDKIDRRELLLLQPVTKVEKHFLHVENYSFAQNGDFLLLQTMEKINKEIVKTLQYINLHGKIKSNIIWSTRNEKVSLGSYDIDGPRNQVVFSIIDSSNVGLNNTTVCYYKEGMKKASLKISKGILGNKEQIAIMPTVSFTDNGRYIKFAFQLERETRRVNQSIAQVEVWSSHDPYLQSVQSNRIKWPVKFDAVLNNVNDKVIYLKSNDKEVFLLQGDFAVEKKISEEELGDRFWEKSNLDSTWLVSLKNGSEYLLPTRARKDNFWFSPDNNYLVYFDADKGGHYFSYNLHTWLLSDISANVQVGQFGFVNHYIRPIGKPEFPAGPAAWLDNNEMLVYDNFDIWRLDLTGKDAAINITGAFGQNNNIILNLFKTSRFYFANLPVIKSNESLLLRAFNTKNKQFGYYMKVDLNAGSPRLLYMGDYFSDKIPICHDVNLSNNGMAPVKARNSDTWIVQRQSTTDAPNYYETSDFRDFKRLTNLQPQKNFRWISEELLTFFHLDGNKGQGILYKPEGFDTTKRYPVLIVFYGAFSNNLHQFLVPAYNFEATTPGRSPAWFLNNGYLVFTPDIYTSPLKYGPEAYNVIEGAVKRLKQLSYVDTNKLGCASHSWSAKLGAYLFTHSASFSATAISEGFIYANPINTALSISDEKSRLQDVEMGQKYGSLWENKEVWLDHTTVLNVDKAQSPLLLFCNKESSDDYQNQTLQLFSALRRLDKSVWWLKYDKGEHTLSDIKELRDYTIRYTQFFDHYLKEGPAPRWMTQGISFELKGCESRYELDPQGTCGLPLGDNCPICKAWNTQYKRSPEMFRKGIKDWVLDEDILVDLEHKILERRNQFNKEEVKQTAEMLKKLNSK
ncbi:hypothetical protein A4D02_13730 [Niastella koreensis]|uniref:Peptidase S9 prolyl oligopeptidase catalytic domain-containing protein n=2 Tax=Niastella koreensis TaxID=354356 RepID=G8TQ09_NIAKG|nr:hypothetical protein [Niastella koreensis]AEW01010.1 hypothetical protein Niako_4757 [Niastella koreensis GR20-10]OQP42620.1 hypothetical protein A4D02_13730 [Niastella koreensis]